MKKNAVVILVTGLGLIVVCVTAPAILATHQVPPAWELSKGDLLGYVGAILGGLLTLVGVAATIYYEHRETWEERVRSSAPCLVPTLLGRREIERLPRQFTSEEGSFFILHPNELPEIKTALKEHEYQRWLDPSEETEMGGGAIAIGPSRIVALAFVIENVGLGPAINYRARIVPFSMEMAQPTDRAAGNSALRIGDSYCIAVYCDTHEPSASGRYRLELTYLDLYGYRYTDDFEFEISDNGQQISLKAMVGPTRSASPEPKEDN